VTLFGKDPLFPAIGGFSPVRAPVSLFPSHKNLAQPGLLSQINVVLKESGLFDRELGGGFPAGTEQSDPTRQRLDILRVAFAMYTEQAKIYRPFLSVVQREYEGHVKIGESAMAQAAKMQEYLTMGDEHRAEAIEEMKSKWREKLRRAHEAVLESKNLYDKEARAAIELRNQVEELSKRCKEIEDQNEYLTGESIALKDISHKQQLELDQLKKQKNLDRVEAEILYITEQNKEMTLRVANMKTDLEMQEVRYTKVTQEHKSFKAEIKYLRKQLKDWETVKDSVSPRPEWKRLQQYFPGMSLNAKQRTRHLSERLALDLRFREARPYLSLFRRMEALPEADSSAKMEIPAQAPQTPQAPVSSSQKRDSIFTWGSTLRKCPHLGLGNLVPCFLRSDKPVTVAIVSTNDLLKFMRDFGIVALSGTDADYNYTVVPEALNMFIGSFGNTAQGTQELGYSLAFALQDMASRSSDVNLFYHTMMMDLDDSSRFAVVEIRASLQTILASLKNKLRRFLEVVIKNFPWAQQVESQLSSIVQPYIDLAPDGVKNFKSLTICQIYSVSRLTQTKLANLLWCR
jgi:archaellum component FlaC